MLPNHIKIVLRDPDCFEMRWLTPGPPTLSIWINKTSDFPVQFSYRIAEMIKKKNSGIRQKENYS